MNLGAILLLLAVAVIVCLILFRPFLEPSARAASQAGLESDHRQSSLLAEKERLLAAIQELEFDHQSGKIDDATFPTLHHELMQKAARVLAVLDRDFPQSNQPGLGSDATGASAGDYDDLEEMIAKRRLTLNQKSTGFCPNCGKAAMEADRFCSRCGHTLNLEENK